MYSNLILLLLWVAMIILVYYIKNRNTEVEVFDPFRILRLELGAVESSIKKKYRRLSVQFHPDKNPNPGGNKYFVEHIAKAYQSLTGPVVCENYEKYGHPDRRQWDDEFDRNGDSSAQLLAAVNAANNAQAIITTLLEEYESVFDVRNFLLINCESLISIYRRCSISADSRVENSETKDSTDDDNVDNKENGYHDAKNENYQDR
ncbi:unnamed protein product [Vicia faba]|uniref:J domain-containing protein n=1 Tax=Vicia faba TaxID=3906 RepID=A0AAV1A4T4_VICFA|nr:unnamed protein product [Vicia faba]